MMPTLIYPLYSNLVGISVQLFTALNEQPVMACLLIFPKMAFPLLVVNILLHFFSLGIFFFKFFFMTGVSDGILPFHTGVFFSLPRWLE